MKIEKVNYQKVFPLGMYVNEKIGIEIQLDDGDSPEYVLSKAKEIVEGWHKAANPELQLAPVQEQGPGPSGAPVINRAAERLAILIENATTQQELNEYAEDAAKYGVEELYNAKVRKLKQK